METPFFTEEIIIEDLNDIKFSDIFVLEEIQHLQDMFSDATGVASIITHPDGTPITTPSNFCKLCSEIIRTTEKGRMNCFRSDAELGKHNPNGPIVRTCFSGDLWDAGASITVGGKHIANWLIGQVKNEHSNIHHMMKYAEEIGADIDEYGKALAEIPVMSFERFNTVANMLFHFANEMSEKAYSNLLLKKQMAVQANMSALLFAKNEELQKANAVKDKFFSIIAHDLKSPFNSILGLSEVLSKNLSALSKDQIQHIGKNINDTADNLFRLLGNLLQWSKIQQNLISVDLNHVSLVNVVQEILCLFKDSVKNKEIEIVVDIPQQLQIYTDTNILQTILRNLISNAIKFTQKGGKIEISTKVSDENLVEIAVKDNGIGMSPEMLENIFRPDIQTGRCGTENEPSSGLGLILCKEFVEKQGGEIFAKSIHGKGSAFYFTVPNQLSE